MSAGHTHGHQHEDVSVTSTEDWRDLLRAKGLRVTPARVLVLSMLETHGHGTPEHVYEHTKQLAPGLSLSTIYRTLETLADHNVVAHTHLVGSSATYMLASHADHGHLVCRNCESVLELDDAITGDIARRIDRAHGFEVDQGHLSMFGLCANCKVSTDRLSSR